MVEYDLVVKPDKERRPAKYKTRATKIEMYGLVKRVIGYIAENRSYESMARALTKYVRNRVKDRDEDFSITGQAVKMWWMKNSRKYGDIVNEMRNAIVTQRHHRYIDKGIKVREQVQKDLKGDAKRASEVAETPYDYEATARIREKIVKVQESGEKAIQQQTPNLNVTNITINPLAEFSDKMQKKLSEMEDEEANTIDVEYEDIDEDEEEEEEELEDDDEEDDEAGDDEEDEGE